MIGQVTAAISLSDVPLFSASTANGGIYLAPGGGVDSTAVSVDAGGMNGMTNNVSLTSEASFLTVESITATGNAAVAMNDGSLFEYPGASYIGIVDILPPSNDGSATGGDYSITRETGTTTWAEDGFEPGGVITISNPPTDPPGLNSTIDYTIASTHGSTLYLVPGETIGAGGGFSGYTIVTVATVAGISAQNVSLTSPFNIGSASSPLLTNATSGLTVAATATSPSSAAIYVDNYSPLTSIGVSTYDGSATILSGFNGFNYADELSFDNNVLSETGTALVTLTNTDSSDGSDGDVIISGTVFVSAISAGISATGAAGAGQILSDGTALIVGNGGTVILSAGSGIGTPGTSIDVFNLATLDATTTTGGIYIANVSLAVHNPLAPINLPMTLSASASNGDIYVSSSIGDIDLSNENTGSRGERLHDWYRKPRRDVRRHCGREWLYRVCEHAHADGSRRDRHNQQPPGNLLARHSDCDGDRWRRPVP